VRPEPDVVLGGRYVLIRRIAVGGMGEVWEATDTLLGRRVAVKLLKEEFRTAATFLARFRAEAIHAGRLNHPGIATVFDYGETSEVAFLVMELVEGQPLSELMTEQPTLPDASKLSMLAQAAEALHAAHEAGVVHRDVKPGNLMVRPDGTVKVTDFGIARALTSAPLTDHGQMVGTPAYVSPEQASGDPVTGASDIYSLAVVAFELFAGRPPFERDTPVALTLAHINDLPPSLPDTVPRRVAELIESALAKDPLQRPPSAERFAEQLREEMSTLQTPPTQVVHPPPDRAPEPTAVWPSTAGPRVPPGSTVRMPLAGRRHVQRRSPMALAVAVFAGLLLVIGAVIWAATRQSLVGDGRDELSVASTISAAPVVTEPPPTEPPATAPPPTEPVVTEPPPAEPPATAPPPAPARPPGAGGAVAEGDAVAFVVDYYERIAAGDYGTTWELLSPEFREARNLTFPRYVAYWENTTLELGDLQFVPGPGLDQGRVRFQARYDTGARVVDETDEITLRRHSDGRLIIEGQRTV
jgi:eukaryotic-like serine/threonine-protein kinase